MTTPAKALPFKGRQDTTHTFTINYTSGDGTNYRGQFVTKKLSIRDVAAMGVRKAQLNGGMHHDPSNPGHGVDFNTDEFNQMMAHLEIAIVSAPPWWDLNNIFDVQVMAVVWEEVVKFETSFLERTRGKKPSGGSGSGDQGTGSGNQEGTDASGTSREVVGSEVQAALEP
jgi:hypothetical protein